MPVPEDNDENPIFEDFKSIFQKFQLGGACSHPPACDRGRSRPRCRGWAGAVRVWTLVWTLVAPTGLSNRRCLP
jgi:hypothetical protein